MGILVYRDQPARREFVGRIDYAVGRFASFAYDPGYVKRGLLAGEVGISELLPLDSELYDARDFGPFFRGLLPEGEVYGNLANLYQVPRSDYLSILEHMGCESIGALTFVSEGANPEEFAPHYERVSKETVEAINRDPARMATFTASSTRLSLAGAQSKVAWFLPRGLNAEYAEPADWFIPRGTAPSSHIVKLSRRGEEDIALNELACSLLATACGIETAKVSMLPDVPGAIAVERYDREWIQSGNDGMLLRRHQEDFCQAVGFEPFYKYQPRGVDASYPSMMVDLVQSTSSDPRADVVELAKRLVFCYAIGNSDAHLKNFSLLYNREWTGRRLAPMYDVTCIPLTGYSTAMPFDVGRHRALDDIDVRDIASLAIELDVGWSEFDRVVAEVIESLESPLLASQADSVECMVERILDNSADRIGVLKRYLDAR